MTSPVDDPVAIQIRDARDDDSWDLIGLIAACWAEYPGCILDVHMEEPWLLAPATAYAEQGGRLWVAEMDRRVVASVALRPAAEPGGVALKSLYVARAARRRGLGERLVALVEAEARGRGASFIELWTDTRFVDAHRLYERRGYVRGPHTRELHDLSKSVEYFYRRDM
ncbi:MAG: GNAT family N-acetyltransferase [Dehalococcoidia bacterium]